MQGLLKIASKANDSFNNANTAVWKKLATNDALAETLAATRSIEQPIITGGWRIEFAALSLIVRIRLFK